GLAQGPQRQAAAPGAPGGSREERGPADAPPQCAGAEDVHEAEGLRWSHAPARGPAAPGARHPGLIGKGRHMASVEKMYATGRRKEAVARVWIWPGEGKITVNNRDIDEYFGRATSKMMLRQALEVVEQLDKVDV